MRHLAVIMMMCVGCMTAANAQSSFTQRLQQSKSGEGKITVTQDKAIEDLVNGPKPVVRTQQTHTTPQTHTTSQTQTTPQTQTENKSTATNQTKQDNVTTPTSPVVAEQPQEPDTTTTTVDESRKKVMKGGYKTNGYRVQVFAGSNSRDSRVKAERVGKEMNALFPGTPVYVHFFSPRWICRIGNYRTYEEAHEVLRAVKKLGYESAVIVKGKITVATPQSDPANL